MSDPKGVPSGPPGGPAEPTEPEQRGDGLGLLPGGARKKWAPLLLVAAGVGAYVAVGPKLPRTHQVVLDIGAESGDIVDLEVSWTHGGTNDDAALTTRWHFANGAPRRLPFEAHLAGGAWDVEVTFERRSRETTRWPYRVNLDGPPFWARDPARDPPVVIPLREALR